MACRCIKCGAVAPCGEKYCDQHFLEECCKTDAERNILLQGHFYPGKLIEKEGRVVYE